MLAKPHLLVVPSILLLGFAILSFVYQTNFSPDVPQAKAAGISPQTDEVAVLLNNVVRTPKTTSVFTTSQLTTETQLPFDTQYQETDELYIGEESVIQPGSEGKLTETFQVYSWGSNEFSRELITSETQDPLPQIIATGTAKNIQTLEMPDGTYAYHQKIRMWAMSYDGHCTGCSGITYSGTPVKYGICAVDPNVIPLGSKVYIAGYGVCLAGDIGGSIQGNVIDLGFENVAQGWWHSQYTDVYLLE